MRDVPAGLPGRELVSAGLADRARSPFVFREGTVDFHHFDPYSQALSKVERCFEQDLADVRAMIETGLVDRERLRELYQAIEPRLYRFPAIDPPAFRRKLDAVLR
jgi:hypothetical protein